MHKSSSRAEIIQNFPNVRHILVVEDPEVKQTITLDGATYSMGRHSSNSIVLSSQKISRNHATLLRRTDVKGNNFSYWILDGDLDGNRSRNGIFINGKKCLVHELKHGDIIEFGADAKARYHIISNYSEEIEHVDPPTSQSHTGKAPEYNPKETLVNPEPRQSQETILISNETLINHTNPEYSRLSSFAELNPNPIIEIDLQGNILYLNSAAIINFKNINQAKLEHPLLSGLLECDLNNNGNLFVREVVINDRVFQQNVHYLPDNKIIRSYIVELTESKKSENELNTILLKYKALFNQASEGILFINTLSKRVIEANSFACKLLGYSSREIVELKLEDLVFEKETIAIDLLRIQQDKVDLSKDYAYRKKDGSIVNVNMKISLISLVNEQIFCVTIADITEKKQSEDKLRYQSCHDIVTGLPNQAMFNRQLSTALSQAKRSQRSIAVMLLELDYAKNPDNSLGQALEQRLIQNCAERLKSCLRSGDTISFWDNDKFAVLMPQISNVEEAAKIAQRILEIIKQPFKLSEYQYNVRMNIGISIYPQDGEDIETLINSADITLFRAKEIGRNNYQFHSLKMNSQASILLKLENLLHHALERDEFILHYQPQISVSNGSIQGIEALLRWQHPELGIVLPANFIALAEQTGLIVPIGEWVIKAACIQSKAWQQQGLPSVRMSVNLSALQFQQPNLTATIERILHETNLEAELLELEVTMNTIIQNVELAREILGELRDLGVHLSVDDFGSGFSAFSYNTLKQLPLNTLKIDQSFIRELKNEPQDLAIISAVVTIGRGFNLRIVAEGVETREQFELLRDLQCEQMQGNWFSRPLAAEEANRFLPFNKELKSW